MSSSDMAAVYQMATVNLFSIGGPIFIVLGSIGGALSLCVFGQKSMRQNPGSIYFIAFSIGNILFLWISLCPFVYVYISGIDLTQFSLFYCRLRQYLMYVLLMLPPSYLTLASIDRTLVTSRNALTRQRSTHRLAFWSIGGMTVIWFLYYIHIWFLVTIQTPAPGVRLCFFESDAYLKFMSYSTMTVSGFLPPCLMSIFGLMTWRNFRQVRIHPTVGEHNTTRFSSKDRQLAIMLLFEILISVVFSLTGSILYVYTQRVSNDSKSLEQQARDFFLLNVGLNLNFIQACTSFYSNFIVSKTFRKNILKLLEKIVPPFCRPYLVNDEQRMPSHTAYMTGVGGMTLRLRPVATNT